MSKRPRDNFDDEAWLSDSSLTMCRPATRGIWMDAICHMRKLARGGILVGRIDDLARLCRCTANDMRAAIDDLKARNAADVHDDGHGTVTLICRRLRRAQTDRESARKRKQNQRSRERGGRGVTPDVTHVSRAMSRESHNEIPSPPSSPPPSLSPTPPLTTTPTPTPTPGAANAVASASPPPPVLRGVAELSDLRSATGSGRKRKTSSLSADQSPVYTGFIAWWCEQGYPAAMQGLEYPFDGANDGRAVKRVLSHSWVAWNLDRAKAVALAYLRTPDAFIARQNRPLSLLGNQLQTWVLQAQKTPAQQQRRQEYIYARSRNDRNADGTRPGEHAEPSTVYDLERMSRESKARRQRHPEAGAEFFNAGEAFAIGPADEATERRAG